MGPVRWMAAAVRFIEHIGLQKIADYGHSLAAYLQEGLGSIKGITVLTPSDPALFGSMTTYRSDTVPYDHLYRILLEKYRLRCRVVTEQGLDALRVSTHLFNSKADCDRVLEATRAAVENRVE